MKVKLKIDFGGYKANDEIVVSDKRAEILIQNGIVKIPENWKPKTIEKKENDENIEIKSSIETDIGIPKVQKDEIENSNKEVGK